MINLEQIELRENQREKGIRELSEEAENDQNRGRKAAGYAWLFFFMG